MKKIYLDYAAATPVLPEVADAMQPYLTERFYNPSALYLDAKAVHRDIENARGRIAHWLGCRPSEVTFTAGGTEANNLAITGVMQKFPDKKVLVSAIEHESVLAPAAQYKHEQVPVKHDGVIDLDALEKLLTDDVVLVSIMYANNEIGTIEPLAKISNLLKQKRHERMLKGNTTPLYFHTDAAQAGNYLHLQTNTLGVDLMTINSGKIYGPKQCGALYVKTGVEIQPQIRGGGQERNMRSGTENPGNIVGFAKALDIVQENREAEVVRIANLQTTFQKLISEKIPQVVINGAKHKLPNNVSVTIPGEDNERLLMGLDEQGIICATGSACSASKEEASHVLAAIGKTDAEAYASLRFTMGRGTAEADVKRAVDALARLLR